MSTSLANVLGQLNLQPGEAYRVALNGYQVEIRRVSPEEESELAHHAMLLPWVWFPDRPGGAIVKPIPGPIDLPDPPHIPTDDEG